MNQDKPKRVFAVASSGGHWIQLLRLRPAFEGQEMIYVTVDKDYQRDVPDQKLCVVQDANMWNKFRLLVQMVQVLLLVLRYRPDVVLSTGAAPGYFAIRFGKWVGARTAWIDSIANSDELSMSGRHVRKHADLWLTQWEHLANSNDGPVYAGSVL